jgi:beta-mannosidase
MTISTLKTTKLFTAISFFLLLLTSAFAASKPASNQVQPLADGWHFRQALGPNDKDIGWMKAQVPGVVHLDLLANKKIDDPFYRDNESKLQWIEKAGWEYTLEFDATADLIAHRNVDLVFDGLDGQCQVFLNGRLILSANNAFRTWRVPVKEYLHAGKNSLWVSFPSAIATADTVADDDPWHLKTKVDAKTYIRKPAFEYGWDWGPRFVTSGISKPVRLEAWERTRIADFAVHQLDVTADSAHINAEVEVDSAIAGPSQLNLNYDDGQKPINILRNVQLHTGLNTISFPIEIVHPKLWYPAGYGAQPLYNFTVQLDGKGTSVAERKLKVGLRSIVLDRHPDQWGRSFQLIVNGIPVFAKGADVIPFDSFPNRVTTAQYRRILESARDANMNMIRHWGGGYYETDEFYSICDELGIMVWQDFMFGNDWQPGTYDFKLNIEAEAEDQLRRLRNHPSIVLWCGNNETEVAFQWSDRPKLPADVRMQMWQDYLTEFSGILARDVARFAPETPYWPSSPSADYEALSEHYQSGDQHDWGVWHGRVPFTDYEKHHWRFVTEYGFQSFPEWKTIESFTVPADRTGIFTPIMLAHQKNNEGNSIIADYLAKDYPEPKDFKNFLYVSQVLQAEGIKIGAEHHRRSRPETMGTIFWQLNDCWPVASWSSIDYNGRWKALLYYARRFYAPVLVSPHLEAGNVNIYVVSDKTEAQNATLRVRLMDFDGKVLLEESKALKLDPLASKVYLAWPMARLTEAGAHDTTKVFVVAELVADGKTVSRNLIYLAPTKAIELKPTRLTTQLTADTKSGAGNYSLQIASPVLARSIQISFGELDGTPADNYFDLLPGESVTIALKSPAALEELRAKMQVISLVDAFTAPVTPDVITVAQAQKK